MYDITDALPQHFFRMTRLQIKIPVCIPPWKILFLHTGQVPDKWYTLFIKIMLKGLVTMVILILLCLALAAVFLYQESKEKYVSAVILDWFLIKFFHFFIWIFGFTFFSFIFFIWIFGFTFFSFIFLFGFFQFFLFVVFSNLVRILCYSSFVWK